MNLLRRRRASAAASPPTSVPPPSPPPPLPPGPAFEHPGAEGFRFDDLVLPWGTTVSAMAAALAARGLLDTAAHPQSPCGRCCKAYGFDAIGVEAGFGHLERPVLSLTYLLAPYDAALPVADFRYWSQPITATLGAPFSVDEADRDDRERGGEGTVLYHAAWKATPAIEISLSVFGGRRTESAGAAAGYLYLTWCDLQAAAAPYLADVQAVEARLARIAADAPEFTVHTLQWDQQLPPDDDDAPARQCRRALSGKPSHVTPAAWRSRLNDRQLAFWVSRDRGSWGLSNRSDTMVFDGKVNADDVTVRWDNRAPSRFGGEMTLDLSWLYLSDVHDSVALTALARSIGRQLGRDIQCDESMDNG